MDDQQITGPVEEQMSQPTPESIDSSGEALAGLAGDSAPADEQVLSETTPMADTPEPVETGADEDDASVPVAEAVEDTADSEIGGDAEEERAVETAASAEEDGEAEPDAEALDHAPEVAEAEISSEESEESEEEGEEQEEDSGPPTQWYVVHGYSGYENRVKKNLEQRIETMEMQDKIFQVVVPTEEEIEIRGGERRIVERRVFPGYILVEMIMDETSWFVVRNTPGVTGFVGTGSRPTPLSDEEVDKIMKRIESAEPTIKVSFKVGQQVRLTGGAFADFVGKVDELYPEKGRAKVLVSMFGRETPLEVELQHLERV